MRLTDDIVITGNRATVRSYAKINLTLDVTGKREDGYHTLETIMQTVNLSDIIVVDKQDFGIKLTTNKKSLPTNNKNIAYKAAELFFKESGINHGAKILIHKNIPIAAGMAGGSGNGAAVLEALNILYDQPFSEEKLLEIGARLGADVPFCMTGRTQLACGIGEIMTPIKNKLKSYVLLITPSIAVSTPWAYNELDNNEKTIFPDTKAMIEALENGDYNKMCANLSNVFEEAIIKKYPVIKNIKEKLLSQGANGALMSGSGPTVFGFFDDYKKAKASLDSLSPLYNDIFLTTTR